MADAAAIKVGRVAPDRAIVQGQIVYTRDTTTRSGRVIADRAAVQRQGTRTVDRAATAPVSRVAADDAGIQGQGALIVDAAAGNGGPILNDKALNGGSHAAHHEKAPARALTIGGGGVALFGKACIPAPREGDILVKQHHLIPGSGIGPDGNVDRVACTGLDDGPIDGSTWGGRAQALGPTETM